VEVAAPQRLGALFEERHVDRRESGVSRALRRRKWTPRIARRDEHSRVGSLHRDRRAPRGRRLTSATSCHHHRGERADRARAGPPAVGPNWLLHTSRIDDPTAAEKVDGVGATWSLTGALLLVTGHAWTTKR
jgi:hypothetical protein